MGKKVVHLIVGLRKGGAETMLYQILKYRCSDNDYKVLTMGEGDYYKALIEEHGVDVMDLNVKRHPLKSFWQLHKMLKGNDTLCCWMYHSNLVGYFAAKHTGIKKIIWCIRHSNLEPSNNKRTTLTINHICARISKNVSLILYNGDRARTAHEAVGYCHDKGVVTVNGCDSNEYKPDPKAKEELKSELGIEAKKQILLSVARDAHIKDIPTFIDAFANLHKEDANTVAVLCGSGITTENEKIVGLCKRNNLIIGKDVFLLGVRHDVSRLMAACDLYVLHSAGEAFPNTLIQAMSCEALCVTTDVGDARIIIDDDYCVVNPKDPVMLSQKVHEMLRLSENEKRLKRSRNRNRVIEKYDIRKIVNQYEEFF